MNNRKMITFGVFCLVAALISAAISSGEDGGNAGVNVGTAKSSASASASGPMEKYFKDDGKPRWYIPPKEGPLVGSQNFWFVTPRDVLPGDFNINSKEIRDVTSGGFVVVPNSVWGKYTYRVTMAEKTEGEGKEFPGAKMLSSRQLTLPDLQKLGKDQVVIFDGKITEVLPDEKGFKAELKFSDKMHACTFEVIDAEKKGRHPDIQSRHYGPHWQHTFDVYYPKERGDKKLPIVMNIHGGGWGALDKCDPGADRWNNLGFAYISINYRFIGDFDMHPAVTVPVAAPLLDAARCIQYIRFHADELGLDKTRLAITGGSAGGATCCWLAMHDDMADPNSADPVARESTRVTCVFPVQAQTSLDPKQMSEWIPGISYGAHAFFSSRNNPEYAKLKKAEETFAYFLAHRDEILPYIKEFSPYELASKDDPPFLNSYGGQKSTLPPSDSSNATHHPKFGEQLNKRLKELGVESYFFADDVQCENPRYNGWTGTANFVCDKLLGEGWDKKGK